MNSQPRRLTYKNPDKGWGLCPTCGKVELLKKGRTWRCANVVRRHTVAARGLEGLDAALQRRNKKCEICGATGKLDVDHCHDTNVVRGLLCHPCNTALGLFKDNQESLLNAIEYLSRPR